MSHLLVVSIESKAFPGTYLRIDGRGFDEKAAAGGGFIDCQDRAASYETLIIENHPDKDTFSILSVNFHGVYLRMDGQEVQDKAPGGSGIVNCQHYAGSYEQFRFVNQADGTKAIASVQFPGAYLRMDGNAKHDDHGGFGKVNCQSYVGSLEKFVVNIL